MGITAGQLHSAKSRLRLEAGSNPALSMSKSHNGADLYQGSQLKIKLNAFHWSRIPQKQPFNSSSSNNRGK